MNKIKIPNKEIILEEIPCDIKNQFTELSFFKKRKIKIIKINLPMSVGNNNFSGLPIAWKNHNGKKEDAIIGNSMYQKYSRFNFIKLDFKKTKSIITKNKVKDNRVNMNVLIITFLCLMSLELIFQCYTHQFPS